MPEVTKHIGPKNEFKITTLNSIKKTDENINTYSSSLTKKYCDALYGSATEYPELHSMELKQTDASIISWQTSKDAAAEICECGSKLFNVKTAVNIGEADNDLDPETTQYAISNGVLRLRFENSLKQLEILVNDIIKNSKNKSTTIADSSIEEIASYIANTPNEDISKYINDKQHQKLFILRAQISVYQVFLKSITSKYKEKKDSVVKDKLAEVYLHAKKVNDEHQFILDTHKNLKKNKTKKKKNTEKDHCWYEMFPFDEKSWDKIMTSCESKLKNYDFLLLQTSSCAHRLAPQNPFVRRTPFLGDFHLDIIRKLRNMIKDNKRNSLKGLLIEATAGSGKTATVLTYLMAIKCRFMIVVPTNTLARQLTADLSKEAQVTMILPNAQRIVYSDSNIYVCTADSAIDVLHDVRCKKKCITEVFDCLVIDEVHSFKQHLYQSNNSRFRSEELLRLIKTETPDIPFVMMSATLADPERSLQDIKNISQSDKVELLQHHHRSTSLRHYTITNDYVLQRFNVLGLATPEYIKTGGLFESSMALAPEDVYDLYHKCKLYWESDVPSSKSFSTLMTLFDIQKLEHNLKEILSTKIEIDQENVMKLIESYKINNEAINLDIHKLLKMLQKRAAYPGLLFTGSAEKTQRLVSSHLTWLKENEDKQYPGRFEEYEWLADAVQKAKSEIILRVDKLVAPKDVDVTHFKVEQEEQLRQKALAQIQIQFSNRIRHKLNKLKSSMSDNIFTETNRFFSGLVSSVNNWTDLRSIDKWKVSEKFSYQSGKQQMLSDNEKRTFRRAISNAHNRNAKILGLQTKKYGYENMFMEGIERGLVHYSNDPAEQMCAQQICNQSKAPFFAGEELAEGVNFPIKTVILVGDESKLSHINPGFIRQARGRAGRMGFFEKGGEVVYVNIDLAVLRSRLGILQEDKINSPLNSLPAKFLKLNVSNKEKRELTALEYCSRIWKSPNPGFNKHIENIEELHPTIFNHRTMSYLLHHLRRFKDAAQIAPLLAIAISGQFQRGDTTSATLDSIFHLFSIAFDPKLKLQKSSYHIITKNENMSKPLHHCLNLITTAGWTWETEDQMTDLMIPFKKNLFDEDTLTIDKIIEYNNRLESILTATQIFINFHSALTDSLSAIKVASIVQPVFDRMLILYNKLSN